VREGPRASCFGRGPLNSIALAIDRGYGHFSVFDTAAWTNRELLFHMLFGYLIVRTLMPLVHGFGRRPPAWSWRFAAILNAGRRPFHLINYLGSCGGGLVVPKAVMTGLMDRTIRTLRGKLADETEDSLALRMHFPTSWDPYFHDMMFNAPPSQ
jgi:hypothetical protein